jgi:SprT protein
MEGMSHLQLQSVAEKETRQLLTSAEQHFKLSPSHPTILFDLKGKTAGVLSIQKYGATKIRYNAALLQQYGQQFIQQTVPHEVAHLIARRLHGPNIKPHGREWRTIMSFFNTPAMRCHNYDTSMSAVRTMRYYEYQCQCKTHQISAIRHNRSNSGVTYLCRLCGSSLVFVGS